MPVRRHVGKIAPFAPVSHTSPSTKTINSPAPLNALLGNLKGKRSGAWGWRIRERSAGIATSLLEAWGFILGGTRILPLSKAMMSRLSVFNSFILSSHSRKATGNYLNDLADFKSFSRLTGRDYGVIDVDVSQRKRKENEMSTKEFSDDQLLSRSDVAEVLGVCPATASRIINESGCRITLHRKVYILGRSVDCPPQQRRPDRSRDNPPGKRRRHQVRRQSIRPPHRPERRLHRGAPHSRMNVRLSAEEHAAIVRRALRRGAHRQRVHAPFGITGHRPPDYQDRYGKAASAVSKPAQSRRES